MERTLEPKRGEEQVEEIQTKPVSAGLASEQRITKDGIVLVPQPTDDPEDPLNWPTWYKIVLLVIISMAAFSSTQASVANAAGFVPQAILYGKTPIELSYSVSGHSMLILAKHALLTATKLSSGAAGICAGPLLWLPISQKFGRGASLFWGVVLAMGCTIWSATMTGQGDYESFVVSRFFCCLAGSVAIAVGSSCIMDIFFLHERGRAFAAYGVISLLGVTIGPTFSGLIVQRAHWPVQFWFTLAIQAGVALALLLFFKETGYSRPGGEQYPQPPKSYVANRLATLTGSRKVIPRKTWAQVGRAGFSQIQIGLTPITLVIGFLQMIVFGWSVGIQTLLGVYLQTPVEEGGYGFTPERQAFFSFVGWFSDGGALLYGTLVADRLPLYLCKRFGKGIWKPEYRLHSLWFSTFLPAPIGLVIFGCALQYHLHYMVLALGGFLVFFGTISTAPVSVNYLVECFTTHPVEVTSVLNFYRLCFGITIPFFIDSWFAAVGGPGWTFGMMAFFSLIPYSLVIFSMFKGPAIRHRTGGTLATSEEGVKLELVDSTDHF